MVNYVQHGITNRFTPYHCLSTKFNAVLIEASLQEEFIDSVIQVDPIAVSFILVVVFPVATNLTTGLQ